MKRLLDYDPLTKTQTWHLYDHQTKKTEIKTVQDVEAVLERNKQLANNDEYKKQGIKQDWYHMATIPNTILMEWKKTHNIDLINPTDDDLKRAEKLLRDPEYKHLRTVNRI